MAICSSEFVSAIFQPRRLHFPIPTDERVEPLAGLLLRGSRYELRHQGDKESKFDVTSHASKHT